MDAVVTTGDLTPDLADALLQEQRIAVDTETSGLDWTTETLELVQLYSASTGPVLVHRIADGPSNLARVLAADAVTKVFHFAPFDLRFLNARRALKVSNVACTKAASKLLDPSLASTEHSLAPLVERYLGEHLSKGAVRTSDWGRDELTSEQIEYAVGDVQHLLNLHEVLLTRMHDRGLETVFDAICAYLPTDAELEVRGIPNPLRY